MRAHHHLRPLSIAALALSVACGSPQTTTTDASTSPTPTPTPTPVLTPSWSVEPVAIAFPATAVGAARESTLTVRNTGETPLRVSVAAGAVTSPAFTAAPASAELAVGAAALFTVTYAPTTAGPHAALLRVSADQPSLTAVDVALAGTTEARGAVRVSTAAIDFGEVVIGEVGRAPLVLENPGEQPIEVLTATATNVASCDAPGPHAFCVTSARGPVGASVTVAARASVELELVFRPTVAGLRERGALGLRACVGGVCAGDAHAVALEGLGVASSVRCDASTLDFGRVGTVACADRAVRCENASDVQRGLVSIALDAARTSTAFTLPTAPALVELGARQSTTVTVRYCPGGSGADSGALVITTDDPDPRQRRIEIALAGTGGGPDLEVTPGALAFGDAALGAPVRRALTLLNRGDEDLRVTAIDAPPEATIVGDVATPIPGGGARTLAVDLTLATAGAFSGELVVHSDDPAEPTIRVAVGGTGVALQPCQYAVAPGALELGVVEPSRRVSRAVEVRNTGSTECILNGARLLPGSHPDFALVEDRRGVRIPAGSSRVVGVSLLPSNVGPRSATLELSMSSPTAPLATVPVSGSGEQVPLLISPHELDFGVIDLGCRARARTVALYNTGTRPLYISDIRLADPPNPVFTLSNLPVLTATVAPSSFVELEVGFQAAGNAEYASAIEVRTGTGTQTLTHVIGLRGHGAQGGIQMDDFQQLGQPLVDILWVIDNSGSMSEEQSSLSSNFLSFVRFADAQALDYHMAITTTDVDASGARGRFVPVNGSSPRIVTPLTQPSAVTVFTQNARVGTSGSGTERGLEASYLALSNPLIALENAGFLRPEAALSVVYVSDEEDSSTARTLDLYVSFLLGIKGAQNANTFTASAIVGEAPSGCRGAGGSASAGARYIEVAERTGGLVQSICTPDWARALENVSTTAFGFKSRFVLSGQPVAGTLTVAVDGVAVPAVDALGAQHWSYDAGANALVFTPYATPEPGAQIHLEYQAECL